jgi:hypothetical protein
MDITKFKEIPTNLLSEVSIDEISEAQLLKEAHKNVEPVTDANIFEPTHEQVNNPIDSFSEIPENPVSSFDSLHTTSAQPSQRKYDMNIGQMFDKRLAVDLLDTAGTTILSIGANKIGGYNIKPSELKATASEKAMLEPVMERVLQELTITTNNPFEALMIAAGTIYGSKLMYVLTTAEKKPKKKEQADGVREFKEVKTTGKGSGQLGRKRGSYKKNAQ